MATAASADDDSEGSGLYTGGRRDFEACATGAAVGAGGDAGSLQCPSPPSLGLDGSAGDLPSSLGWQLLYARMLASIRSLCGDNGNGTISAGSVSGGAAAAHRMTEATGDDRSTAKRLKAALEAEQVVDLSEFVAPAAGLVLYQQHFDEEKIPWLPLDRSAEEGEAFFRDAILSRVERAWGKTRSLGPWYQPGPAVLEEDDLEADD
eukprot:s8104_g3.t1